MIGIIPAAGKAERMNGIPKMLLPTPKGALIDVLRSRMVSGDGEEVKRIVIGCNGYIRDYLRPRAMMTPDSLTYEAITETMSETVLLAERYVRDGEWSQFGMPDTYFDDDQAFVKLAAALSDGADVAVGVFHARPEQRSSLGMCRIDQTGHIIGVADKQPNTDLEWAWGVLAWKSAFWEYIHADTPHIGYAIPLAAARGLDVRAVKMEGQYWDCGTPNSYFDLIAYLHNKVRA